MSEDWKPEVVMAGLREKDYRAKRPEKVSQPTERRRAKQPRHQEQAGQRPESRSMLATLKSEPPRSQCGGAEKAVREGVGKQGREQAGWCQCRPRRPR